MGLGGRWLRRAAVRAAVVNLRVRVHPVRAQVRVPVQVRDLVLAAVRPAAPVRAVRAAVVLPAAQVRVVVPVLPVVQVRVVVPVHPAAAVHPAVRVRAAVHRAVPAQVRPVRVLRGVPVQSNPAAVLGILPAVPVNRPAAPDNHRAVLVNLRQAVLVNHHRHRAAGLADLVGPVVLEVHRAGREVLLVRQRGKWDMRRKRR